MMRVGLSHDPLRFYLSFYDVSFKKAFSNERFLGFFQTTLHSGFCFDLYFAPFLPPPPSHDFLLFTFSFKKIPSLFFFFFFFLLFFFSSFFLFFFSSFFFSSYSCARTEKFFFGLWKIFFQFARTEKIFFGLWKIFFSLHAQKNFFSGLGKFFSAWFRKNFIFRH